MTPIYHKGAKITGDFLLRKATGNYDEVTTDHLYNCLKDGQHKIHDLITKNTRKGTVFLQPSKVWTCIYPTVTFPATKRDLQLTAQALRALFWEQTYLSGVLYFKKTTHELDQLGY